MIGALINAGGAGARMGAPKPLVAVRGASLLERNLSALIGAGVRAIWISCADDHAAVRAEIARLAFAAGGRGVTVAELVEDVPLGTIGAAGALRGRAGPIVAVNADNLTALDLAALLAHHAGTGADLTLATHDHATQLPYGAVDVDGERVVAYREKPVATTRIASAVCVLGARALDALVPPRRVGLDELAARLIAGGDRVVAHHHAAPWIDVNEPADVARAAALIAAHGDRFECWAREPDLEVAGALLRDGDRILLERRRDTGRWDTPGGKLEAGEGAAAAIARELAEELGIAVEPGPELGRFDTLEPDGRAIRHHVFAPVCDRAAIAPREGQTVEWMLVGRLPAERAAAVDRSLAVERA